MNTIAVKAPKLSSKRWLVGIAVLSGVLCLTGMGVYLQIPPLLTLCMVLVLLLVTGALLMLCYHQQQLALAKAFAIQEQSYLAAVSQREQRFRDYSESSADWFWETDATHRFIYLSKNTASMLGGRSVQSLLGRSRMEVAAEDGLYQSKIWEEHIEVLEKRLSFRNFEYSLLDGAGQRVCLSVSGVPVFDAAGTFAGYRGVGQIITERQLAKETLALQQANLETMFEARTAELAAAEAHLRMIIDSSGDGIIEVDVSGRIIMVNPAAYLLLRYQPGTLLGCSLHNTLHHSYLDGKRSINPNLVTLIKFPHPCNI